MQPLSNKELLRGFNRNEEKARNAVYDRYHDALMVMIKKMTNESSSAEDLVNDTFEVFFENTRHFDDLSQMRDFLFQTGKNICINHLKKEESDQKKHAEWQKLHAQGNVDFYADITYSETRTILFKSIDALPDKLKVVFRLRHFQGLSNDAVAEQLNIAGKTVYNRYYEARQRLKLELEQIKRFTNYLLNLFL